MNFFWPKKIKYYINQFNKNIIHAYHLENRVLLSKKKMKIIIKLNKIHNKIIIITIANMYNIKLINNTINNIKINNIILIIK